MSSSFLNLRHVVHSYAKHNWQLAVASAIQVAGLQNFAHATSSSQQLDLLTSRDLWVTRGEGLRISIHILLDGKNFIEAPAAAEVLETIGPVLRDAELWSQLRLLPSLSLPTISGSTPSAQTGDIVLSLAHAQRSGTVPGRVNRRKRYTDDLSPARPPDGVPSAGLESINITLDLSCGRSRSRTISLEMGGELAESLQTDFLALDKDFSDLEQEYYSQPVTSKQNLCSDEVNLARRCASQPTYPASDDEMLDDPSYTSTSRAATSDRLEVARIEGHDTSVAYIRGFEIGSKVTNDGGDEPPWTFEDFDLQRLLELTDAALRTLICAKPIRTTGIKVLGASSGPKLADISPALFSPDYLPAVSQRAPMISNIAYAMKLFQRRSASATLEAKLARLESLPPSPLIAVDEDAELMTPPNNRISSVVKARVWRIMQKKLYKPEAARRLKPIQPKDGIILLQEPDEMLDESSAPSLETDFESLFEDEDNYILFADLDPEKPGQYSEDDDILREYDDPDDGMLDNGEDLEDWRWRHEEMLEHDCSGDEDMEDLEMLTNVESTYGHDHADQQLPLPYRHPVHNEGANTSPGPEDDDMLFTADHVPYVNETLSSNDPLPHNRGPSTPPSTEDEDLLFLDESRTNNEKVLEGDDDDDLLFEQERCFHALCWDARKDDRNKDDDDEEMMLM